MTIELKEPYTIEGQYTGGGLGELFKCRDANGVPFAAKLPKDRSPSSQQMINDEIRRFVRHQGKYVVQFYGDVRHTDGRTGFAMERMDHSLSWLIRERGRLEPDQALGYFQNLVYGLNETHASAAGAHHGDIKPANLLIKNGFAKLADFGIARGGAGQTMMLATNYGGTPGYMPPEGYASAKGDVYSAGRTLWAMLLGKEPPFTSADTYSFTGRPLLRALLEGMDRSDPRSRFSVADVLQRLPGVRGEGSSAGSWLLGAGLGVAAVLTVASLLGKK